MSSFNKITTLTKSEADAKTVRGKLDLSGQSELATLPAGLNVDWLDVSGCDALSALPTDLRVRRLTANGPGDPSRLLGGLRCYHLELRDSAITRFPAGVEVEYRIDLEGCAALQTLPENLRADVLNLRGCSALAKLPEGLACSFLDISGCTLMREWPQRASVSMGRFAARGCLQLREVPPWVTSIAQLDLRDCVKIRQLPQTLTIAAWVDVAGTKIRSLQDNLKDVQLRWRGVAVDQRVAFFPETITVEEVLNERNAERRRVLLERMGNEVFLSKAKAEVLDEDRDPGGPRKLLKVILPRDEDLVCVSVICPSTRRQYMIRVPPTTRTCHQAAAWIAGFDDPAKYRPLVET